MLDDIATESGRSSCIATTDTHVQQGVVALHGTLRTTRARRAHMRARAEAWAQACTHARTCRAMGETCVPPNTGICHRRTLQSAVIPSRHVRIICNGWWYRLEDAHVQQEAWMHYVAALRPGLLHTCHCIRATWEKNTWSACACAQHRVKVGWRAVHGKSCVWRPLLLLLIRRKSTRGAKILSMQGDRLTA